MNGDKTCNVLVETAERPPSDRPLVLYFASFLDRPTVDLALSV
jgi:hypothetical protein